MAKALTAETKSTRIEVRATASQQDLILRGAAARNQSVTEFMIETACLEAEMAVLDQRIKVISDEEYDAFQALLDRPAKVDEGLRELFSRRSSWQTPNN